MLSNRKEHGLTWLLESRAGYLQPGRDDVTPTIDIDASMMTAAVPNNKQNSTFNNEEMLLLRQTKLDCSQLWSPSLKHLLTSPQILLILIWHPIWLNVLLFSYPAIPLTLPSDLSSNHREGVPCQSHLGNRSDVVRCLRYSERRTVCGGNRDCGLRGRNGSCVSNVGHGSCSQVWHSKMQHASVKSVQLPQFNGAEENFQIFVDKKPVFCGSVPVFIGNPVDKGSRSTKYWKGGFVKWCRCQNKAREGITTQLNNVNDDRIRYVDCISSKNKWLAWWPGNNCDSGVAQTNIHHKISSPWLSWEENSIRSMRNDEDLSTIFEQIWGVENQFWNTMISQDC